MAKNSQPRCLTCRFWDRLGEQNGACHRYPGMTTTRLFKSPVDWCGEHKQPPRKKKGKTNGAETNL